MNVEAPCAVCFINFWSKVESANSYRAATACPMTAEIIGGGEGVSEKVTQTAGLKLCRYL
jgi:hypothetical protein